MLGIYYFWISLLLLAIGLEWLAAGINKFSSKQFIEKISDTLIFFAEKNTCGFYKKFLTSYAIPKAQIFGNVVRFSQVVFGSIITLSSIFFMLNGVENSKIILVTLVISLIGGSMMNLNFYLAAGWTNPAVATVNRIMGLTQIYLIGVMVQLLYSLY